LKPTAGLVPFLVSVAQSAGYLGDPTHRCALRVQMSPTGSIHEASSSVPLRTLSTPIDGLPPCAMRLPHVPQS
jgi:hypothetical protein